MERDLQLLDLAVDILVIGGGITGCGIALDAASRGLKVVLIEKNDLGSGTSSKSSRLIHGGLRYLKQFQFKTTFEASREKTLLKKLAPNLIEDIPFVLPYWSLKNRFMFSAGLWIYDLMAGLPRGLIHKHLNREETFDLLPLLRQDIKGSFKYYDAKTHDRYLVLTVAEKAQEFGAVIRTNTPMTGFIKHGGKIVGVTTNDSPILARHVINATGVWSDRTREPESPFGFLPSRIKPSKGVHLMVSTDRLNIKAAAMLPTFDDRIFFLVPQSTYTIIGTTDTKYDGDLDNVTAETEDIDYLLKCVNDNMPDIKLGMSDVIGTYAGLRPLINSPKSVFKSSRDHKIFEDSDGLISIVGGKLTTYRRMAKDVVNMLTDKKSITHEIKLGS